MWPLSEFSGVRYFMSVIWICVKSLLLCDLHKICQSSSFFLCSYFLTLQCVIAPLYAWRAQREVNISMKWQKYDVFFQILFLWNFIALFSLKKIAENYLPRTLTKISIMCFAIKRKGNQIYQKEKNWKKPVHQQFSSIYESQTAFFRNGSLFYLLIAGNHCFLIWTALCKFVLSCFCK